jgi:hypothetical protein
VAPRGPSRRRDPADPANAVSREGPRRPGDGPARGTSGGQVPTAGGPPERRPWVIRALAAWLGLAPLLRGLSLAGLRFANFTPDHPWNYAAYGVAAPYVAWLVWRRHARARFAAYVFLTHEAVRGAHGRHWAAVALAVLWVALLQTRPARQWVPTLDPAAIRARWRRTP